MSAAVNDPTTPVTGQLTAQLGPYFLYCVTPGHYQLFAPDNNCPRAWLQHHLPAGDWYTEWSGEGDYLVVDFTR